MNMTSQRWRQVREVFETVYPAPPEEREGRLSAACGGDLELRAEIESLIASYEQAPAAFDAPAFDAISSLLRAESQDAFVGSRVGAYELTHVIARGGMGTVYEANRADGQFQQRVAIKLVNRVVAHRDVLRRFRNELQTLAKLSHPNIARLLDGGVTEDGVPFLIIEYVDGQPIDEYCDMQRLSLEARMRLFQSICAAVQYAHQRLIVHRDLKPGNILVTRQGIAKLLDFGIAELLDADGCNSSHQQVATEHRLMTPEYASPEQIRGEPVTTASDVYSLGVVLYQLLTGLRPYRLKSRFRDDLVRTICETATVKPSTALRRQFTSTESEDGGATLEDLSSFRGLQPDQLRKRLTGDLDTIVLMAMRKEPERRYQTPEQLAEDIRRHLTGLPVLARRPTLAYRARKFVRRNASLVIAASIAALASLGGVIGIDWQYRQTARQRDLAVVARHHAESETERARIEARKLDQTIEFFQTMLGEANPMLGERDVSVLQVLEQSERRIPAEFANQPELESAIRTAIGKTQMGLGRYDAARANLSRSLQIQRGLHERNHPDVAARLRDLGILYYELGDYEEADRTASEALEMNRAWFGDGAVEIAPDLNNLAAIRRAQDDLKGAEEMLREALDLRIRFLGNEHLDTAETLNNLANIMRLKGNLPEAEALCRRVLAIRQRELGEQHPLVAQSMDNLGTVLSSQGAFEEAVSLQRKAIASARNALGEDHPELGTIMYNLGVALCMMDECEEAVPYLESSLRIRRQHFPEHHRSLLTPSLILGECQLRLKQYGAAETSLLAGYETAVETVGGEHPLALRLADDLVRVYSATAQVSKAATWRKNLRSNRPG